MFTDDIAVAINCFLAAIVCVIGLTVGNNHLLTFLIIAAVMACGGLYIILFIIVGIEEIIIKGGNNYDKRR